MLLKSPHDFHLKILCRESQIVTGIVDLPDLSPTVQMDQAESLFGLQEKLVAVESAVYLAKQIQSLKGDILQCVSHDQRSLVDNYESQVRPITF